MLCGLLIDIKECTDNIKNIQLLELAKELFIEPTNINDTKIINLANEVYNVKSCFIQRKNKINSAIAMTIP